MHIELEDGMPPERKGEGRNTIAEALQKFDWSDKLTHIRINNVGSGFVEDDVDMVAQGKPNAFLLGKREGPEDIQYRDHLVSRAEKKYGLRTAPSGSPPRSSVRGR